MGDELLSLCSLETLKTAGNCPFVCAESRLTVIVQSRNDPYKVTKSG